jgi:hypothetical protein
MKRRAKASTRAKRAPAPVEQWYGVKLVFEWRKQRRRFGYEERVVLVRAKSFEHAIDEAEHEAKEYVAGAGFELRYVSFADAYLISAQRVRHRTEVYSVLRRSRLSPTRFLNRFIDTGEERRRQASVTGSR